MWLSSWAEITQGQLLGKDCRVVRICTDTRKLAAGDVFFAIKGANFDAHDFLAQAQEIGASALVVERADSSLSIPQLVVGDVLVALGQVAAAWRRCFTGTLVAITGSCGKTTVKGMLRAIFEQAGSTLATQGNLNNHIGVPITLLQLTAEHQFAVIEMGASGRDEIAYLTALGQPTIALVNNVMAAHIEGFGSLEGVAAEKLRIYEGLQADGVAVINLDDAYAPKALPLTAAYRRLGFSLQADEAFIKHAAAEGIELSLATAIRASASGCGEFEWQIDGATYPVTLRVLGLHNVGNALAAATCAWGAGVAPAHIVAGLAAFAGEKGRMQLHHTAAGAILIDDTYNANPGSVAAAIEFLAGRSGRTFLILGDMKELGENALQEHHLVGSLAATKGLQSLWACGELSRAAVEGFGQGGMHYSSQTALLEALRAALLPGDTLLIKGSRSSRMDIIVNGLLASGESPAC